MEQDKKKVFTTIMSTKNSDNWVQVIHKNQLKEKQFTVSEPIREQMPR